MNERSNLIRRLRGNIDSRASYIKSKLGVLVPSQIRALRLQSEMPRQSDLASAAGLHQSRISMFETPGAANMTIETLSRMAAAFKVGLVVKFVPFSEMLQWENDFSQDRFRVTPLDEDIQFQDPGTGEAEEASAAGGSEQEMSARVATRPSYDRLSICAAKPSDFPSQASSPLGSLVAAQDGELPPRLAAIA